MSKQSSSPGWFTECFCYRRFLEGAKLGVPELYLFSKEDELTDRGRLLQLIATRQAG